MVPLKHSRNLGTPSEISTLQRQFPRSTAPAATPACKPGCMEMPLCAETFRRVRGKGRNLPANSVYSCVVGTRVSVLMVME